MEKRRRVTEEDLLVTEALIAESYGRLKRSVARAPYRALRSAGGAVLEHPLAAAATATVGGILAYQVLRMVMPRGAGRGRSPSAEAKGAGSHDPAREVLSMVLPVVAPYIVGYIREALGGTPESRR
ncbi:MAG: hypothetical protein LUQ23_04100 [Methanomicrobiales archaeon]|nr:hypothetical protein [Methanomicrobiales archaeon]MDD1670869.1 hypothetical protein [Methanomicrobiales archaeon]